MALAKYYEDIIERRGDNRARIEFKYQHPQTNVRRAASTKSFAHRRQAADVPSPQIVVWLTIFDDESPAGRRKSIITSPAVRTGRSGA
jgi:hypothetical protein